MVVEIQYKDLVRETLAWECPVVLFAVTDQQLPLVQSSDGFDILEIFRSPFLFQ